ncbi:amidohydrolase family protein [Streptomyces sp. NPDC101234]|uniref:amidohydrolase family protein n=1 Tax=Streptomyces sp. NPDC101234 TaxID=3366138 RepID=UPI00382C10E1
MARDLHDARFDEAGSTLVRQAILVTGTNDGVFRGDLLIREGRIVEVAPQLDVTDAEIVDGTDYIVCAGFIDTHRHLWQTVHKGFVYDMSLLEVFTSLYGAYSMRFRPEDIYAATLLGRLTALDAGVTTVLDWAHNVSTTAMEDAGIQALRDAGGRSIFGHGYVGDRLFDIPRYYDQPRTFEAANRIRQILPDDDALVSSCYLGLEPPFFISLEACGREYEIARELGMRISTHLNSLGPDGTAPFPTLEAMHKAGLMGDDITYVHLIGATDHEMQLIADTGGTASVSPQIDAHVESFAAPPTGRLLAAGVRPSLSIDGTIGASEDFFSQMRCAFDVERTITKNKFEPRPADYKLTLNDVFDFATLQGARAIGQGHRLGSIEPGKVADLLFISTTSPNMMPVIHPLAALVFHANTSDIDTVLVEGKPVKRNGRLVADLDDVRRRVEETVDHLYWRAESELPPQAARPHPAMRPCGSIQEGIRNAADHHQL